MTLKLRDWIPIDKLDWYWLSKNPNAIHILEKNLNKVNWLSSNPNAIPILEKNIDKIDWCELSQNPSIFTYDYDDMTERPFVEELMQHLYHPDRLVRQRDVFGYDIGEDVYI